MTKIIATALVASLGFAAAASANSAALVNTAQDKLDAYGFTVDADTLSNAQLTALYFVDTGDADTASQARALIRSAIN